MRHFRVFTLAGLAAVAMVATAGVPACAHTKVSTATATPRTALWKVTSAQRTLYITGAVMASLKKHPIPAVMTAAFKQSGSLIVEGTPVHSTHELEQLKAFIMLHGMEAKGHTLADELTASQQALVKKAGATVGVPYAAMQHFQPWWAACMLFGKRVVKSGVKPHQLYLHFYAVAKQANKPVSMLNTDIGELQLYAGLPRKVQVAWLMRMSGKAGTSYLTPKRAQEVSAWRHGDRQPWAAKVATLKRTAPQFYRTMVASYEPHWLTKLEGQLDHAGKPVFVIVQYTNLVGPTNMLSRLRKAGYQVAQL